MKPSLLTKTEMVASKATVPVPMDIRPLIYEIRGRQVMLDRDLAALYGVLTKNLNKAVKRNVERFPEDFMFQLTKEECLRFQSGTLETGTIANMDTLRFQNGTSKQVATLDMLAKRGRGVKVELVTHSNGELAESDFEAFAKQCGNFTKTICGICHDRFIIADQKEIYWSGASLKDAGRLTFARPCGLPSKARRFFGGYSAKLGAEMIPGLLASIRKATSATNSYKKGGVVK